MEFLVSYRRRLAAWRDMFEDFRASEPLHPAPSPLPPRLVVLSSPEGEALFAGAVSQTHELVAPHLRPQTHANACGIASALTVMAAIGTPKSERDLFTGDALLVRTRREVRRGGMSLRHFDAFLRLHGLRTLLRRGDTLSKDEFRAAVTDAMVAGRLVVVNYDRSILGQESVGHISPLTAYNPDADMALVLDAAAHKYPPHWVPLEMLHAAMAKPTRSGGPARGFVIVEGFAAN